MRLFTIAVLASLLGASCGQAFAQVATGDEVSVNPVTGAGTTLLYPGGQYMRVVPPLLEPGENIKDSGPLTLHMPGRRTAHAVPTEQTAAAPAPIPAKPRRIAAAPSPAKPRRVAATPSPVAVAPSPPKPKRAAAATPPSAPVNPSGYSIFGTPQGAAGLDLGPAALPPAPAPTKQVAKASPVPAAPGPMTAEPSTPGLTKRSVILFAAGASDPAQSALGAIKFLAGDLNASMTGPNSRIQILAYGGDRGDKGSDARRLSLKRALAIRQVLIDDGVGSERIDVRAMGGADDGGPADRVDVYIKI